MITGNATLVVDLGNSNTKCMVLFGKNPSTGKVRTEKFELSNVFDAVDDNYVIGEQYNESSSTMLYVDTVVNDFKLKGMYVTGEVQRIETHHNAIKPSATAKKYELESTALSYRVAFFNAYKAIMHMQSITDYKALQDITWTVVTLLPPGDLKNGKEPLSKIIRDITELDIRFPEVKLPITINKISVLPEGYSAYAGIVYDRGNVFRPEYKFLTEEIVLVIDIGAGTSDCLIINNNKLVSNAMDSIELGGNNVEKLVARMVKAKGYQINNATFSEDIIKGHIKNGAKTISIVEDINSARKDISGSIISQFIDFLEANTIPIKTIGYVLVCGGGSMSDVDNEELLPISKYIIDKINQLSKDTELIELPKHKVQVEKEDGDFDVVEEKINARELNLLGASILAELVQ